MKFHEWTNSDGEVLILRRVPKDRKTCNGFVWPRGVGASVEAPDWGTKGDTECGGGLHGWPWGWGIGDGCDYDIINDIWLVVGVKPGDIRGELDDGAKCKFHRGIIRVEGSFLDAMAAIRTGFEKCVAAVAKHNTDSLESAAVGHHSISAAAGTYSKSAVAGHSSKSAAAGQSGRSAAAGDYSESVAAGDYSASAAAGDYSKSAAAGRQSTSTAAGRHSKSAAAGKCSKSTAAGDYSKSAVAGDYSNSAVAGHQSTSTVAGHHSKSAAAGIYSKSAAAGQYSTSAIAGDYSKSAAAGCHSKSAAVGHHSKSTAAGNNTIATIAGTGRVRAGENGAIAIAYQEDDGGYRFVCGKVGEDGIKADTWYIVQDGKLVPIDE